MSLDNFNFILSYMTEIRIYVLIFKTLIGDELSVPH